MKAVTLVVLDRPQGRHLRLLAELPDETTIAVGDTAEAVAGRIAEARAIFCGLGMGPLLEQVLPAARRIEWIHSMSAGVEGVLAPALLESPAVLTNARGAFSSSLGEYVMAAVLYFAKDLRRMVSSQQAGRWDPFEVENIIGSTLGIVGYGDIGRDVARKARVLGVRVLAARRRPLLSEGDPDVEQIYSPGRLREMLAECDWVVVAAPLTPATRGLIGARELEALKPSAVLINIGRGPVIDEAALVDTLRGGRIRGAALDVFEQEPLPDGHPFYSLENVLLSAHCADHYPGWQDDGMRVFLRNFERFVTGAPLDNLVDKQAGY